MDTVRAVARPGAMPVTMQVGMTVAGGHCTVHLVATEHSVVTGPTDGQVETFHDIYYTNRSQKNNS